MKEAKEFASFAIKIGMHLEKHLGDKKIDVNELLEYLPLLLVAPDAIKGINLIDDEWKKANLLDKQMLIKDIEVELNLSNKKTEEIIECSLRIALDVAELIKKLKA